MSIRVFLADDHRVFRQGLRGIIEAEADLTVAGEAGDGRAALAGIAATSPHVVLMDVSMPGLNGIDATRQLAAERPGARVVGLSMHVDERFVVEMLRAGAAGYLGKKCDAEEVLAAIRTVAAGETYLSPAVSGVVVGAYLRSAARPASSAFADLTDRERQVLQMLAEEQTVKEIAADLGISIKTVHAHRERLMQKLGVHTVAGLTKYAVREGLIEL